MPLVTFAEANLAFGDAPLLDYADLTLDAGERVARIGRNGSGKTTLTDGDRHDCGYAGFSAFRTAGGCACRLTTTPKSRKRYLRRLWRRSTHGRKWPKTQHAHTEAASDRNINLILRTGSA
jgi:hypothetical protein